MKNQIKNYFLILMGIFFGIQIVRKDIFPYNLLREWKNSYKVKLNKNSDNVWNLPSNKNFDNDITIKIPIEFLPKYSLNQNSDKLELSTAKDTLLVKSKNIGLVLVDTWGEKNEALNPRGIIKKQKVFLDRARKSNITVIHAPNKPVVNKYSQYHKIKNIVLDSIKKYEYIENLPVFLKEGSIQNEMYLKEREIRKINKVEIYNKSPKSERDISIHLTPEDNEYVLESFEELRYVIWKHELQLLIYIGGGTNECMLHRDTGINKFSGIDKERLPITIVVLEDCSSAAGSPILSDSLFSVAMLEYYKKKIAFISNSENIQFDN